MQRGGHRGPPLQQGQQPPRLVAPQHGLWSGCGHQRNAHQENSLRRQGARVAKPQQANSREGPPVQPRQWQERALASQHVQQRRGLALTLCRMHVKLASSLSCQHGLSQQLQRGLTHLMLAADLRHHPGLALPATPDPRNLMPTSDQTHRLGLALPATPDPRNLMPASDQTHRSMPPALPMKEAAGGIAARFR